TLYAEKRGIIACRGRSAAQRPLASGRPACCQAPMPPSSTKTFSNPALARRFAAPPAVWPVLHTSTTGRALAGASCLFSGSNWLICTFFAPGMCPFSKSPMGRRSTTSAFSRLTSAVSPAGWMPLKPRNRFAISLPMMARVRPASASERMGCRAAKAVSSAKSMAGLSQVGRWPSVLPEVGQAAGDPPGPALRVVAPALHVARLPRLLGVAVDHAQPDLPRRGAVARARAVVAIGGDADLLVAFERQRGHRVRFAVFRIDHAPGALEVAPADRRRPRVLRFAQGAAAVPGGRAGGHGQQC